MRKQQWLGAGQTGVATPKDDLSPKEDYAERLVGVRGIIHWELLPTDCTIRADLYCE